MDSEKRRILIVEDELSIAYLLRQNLEFEGYDVLEASDGELGLTMAQNHAPDLVLLDLMLPKMSGMEVCKRLRASGSDLPVIMLTAKGEQIDKVVGLKAGADDYITKPFDFMELSARIEALLRRRAKSPGAAQMVRVRNLEVDFTGQIIRDGQKELPLSQVEAQLLKYLIQHEGEVLSREKIMQDVWGHDYLLSSRTIDTHVTHLRQKLEENPGQPKHIVTIHRVGYKFVR